MFPLNLDDLMDSVDPSDLHAVCPDCGGRGWWASYPANGDPPEQIQCERCWGSGKVDECSLTETERVAYKEAFEDAAAWDVTLRDGLEEPDEVWDDDDESPNQ